MTFKGEQIPPANFRAALDKTGDTITLVARRLGVSRQYVSGLIHGKRGVSVGRADELARAFDVPIIDLLQGTRIVKVLQGGES